MGSQTSLSLVAHRTLRGADDWSPWQLGQEGKVPLQSAHLYYNVTEKVRRIMESYFRLDTPLYFSYSHLVCRTAIEGGPRHPAALGSEHTMPTVLDPEDRDRSGMLSLHTSQGIRTQPGCSPVCREQL